MNRAGITIVLSLALFSFNYTVSAQDWAWLNPHPQGNHLADVMFVDENTAYAVGMGL